MNNEESNLGQKGQQQDAASERLQNMSRRGLNMATGGAWNRVRNAPVIGAAAKKAENKVADKLENSKLGRKVADPKNHPKCPSLFLQALVFGHL